MNKIVIPHSGGERPSPSTELAKALGRLKTVSHMALHGLIDTNGATRDNATGMYLLPYEGSTENAQKGFLALPSDYKVSVGTDANPKPKNEDPTYSYIGQQERWLNLSKTVLDVHSCRPDVVVAAVPVKPLVLAMTLRRSEWINRAAVTGQVAVIRDTEVIGDDKRAGQLQPAIMDLFLRSSRAAFAVAVTNSIVSEIPNRSVTS